MKSIIENRKALNDSIKEHLESEINKLFAYAQYMIPIEDGDIGIENTINLSNAVKAITKIIMNNR